MFGLALVQGDWKVYVSGLLDREQQDWYLLNITASDGLYVARAAVEVTVMDANDNSPICNQVRGAKVFAKRLVIHSSGNLIPPFCANLLVLCLPLWRPNVMDH